MIPPTPATDDLCGATMVIDTQVLLDLFECHNVLDVWKRGALPGAADLGTRCTRARDALLMAILLHKTKARTYSLREEWLRVLEKLAPPTVNEIPTFFSRVMHLYVLPELLQDWRVVFPDEGGAPEPSGTKADRELERVAQAYGLPLMTLDAKSAKRARNLGVTVITPADYVTSSGCDAARELDAFFQRYLDGLPAFCRTQPVDPHALELRMHWVHDVVWTGIRMRAA